MAGGYLRAYGVRKKDEPLMAAVPGKLEAPVDSAEEGEHNGTIGDLEVERLV